MCCGLLVEVGIPISADIDLPLFFIAFCFCICFEVLTTVLTHINLTSSLRWPHGENIARYQNCCQLLMVQLRKGQTPQPPSTKAMDNREDSSSSDEGNSALISDGDRSRISSPPSAADMSYVVDDGHASSQAQESAYPVLLPSAQLLALSERHPSAEIPSRIRSATIDSSSIDHESLLGNRAVSLNIKSENIENDESPLSYKSLEERTTNAAQASRWERSQSHEQLSTAQYSSIYDLDRRQQSYSKNATTTSNESDELEQKPAVLKDSQRTGGLKLKQGTALRRGKWTVEEEAYVARVIQDFNSGFLDAPAGTTLRTYLSEKLKCDPMRITKKFTGDACIGKRVFHPVIRTPSNASTIDTAQVSNQF